MIATGMVDRGWDVDVFFGFDGPFVHSIKRNHCSTHIVEHRNWLRAEGILRFAKNMRDEHIASAAFERAFEKTCPDIVYVNTLVSYAAASAARRMGIPIVWHVRELFADNHGELAWPASFAKPFVRGIIKRLASQIVVNSSAVACNVFGTGSDVSFENVPNAVDPQFFIPRGNSTKSRKKLGLPVGVPLVGLPGTLRLVKGHDFLFNAIPLVLERIPDCHFAITGAIDSEFARTLVAVAEKQPHAARIIFTRAIGDMLSFYHGCDVCCVPSRSEPFGRTAIECFATRTPLVASAVGGLTEIVRDNENALLVPFGNESALADAIVLLVTDGTRRHTLVEQAALDAKEQYTEAAYMGRVASIVNDTLVAN